MIKSMTGYGKSTFIIDKSNFVVEIKTLNSKQLEVNARISSQFRAKEKEIRSLLGQELRRGKIDLFIYEDKSNSQEVHINQRLVKSYYNTLRQLSKDIGNKVETDIFSHILSFPEVTLLPYEELTDEMWSVMKQAILESCSQVNAYRVEEGKALSEDIKGRMGKIDNLIDEITPLEQSRIDRVKAKMDAFFRENQIEIKFDEHRLEQEIFYYIEKMDITEEKVRLRQHCSFFLETLKEKQSNGKKLAFIVQECGREINTIGAKSNDFLIQQIVVQMKDELEKIKEQLFNIL